MRLATLMPGPDGITDIYRFTTYGGGLIPRDKRAGVGLAFAAVLNDPDARATRDTYERAVILTTGGFDD